MKNLIKRVTIFQPFVIYMHANVQGYFLESQPK